MPIEVGLWKLGDRLEKIDFTPMDSESRLEQVLADDVSVIDPNLLLIGRQVPTAYGKFIDLLAIDGDKPGHAPVRNSIPESIAA